MAGDVEREFEPKNPLELRAALGFATIFVAMLVATHLVVTYLGKAGVYSTPNDALVPPACVIPMMNGSTSGTPIRAASRLLLEAAIRIAPAASWPLFAVAGLGLVSVVGLWNSSVYVPCPVTWLAQQHGGVRRRKPRARRRTPPCCSPWERFWDASPCPPWPSAWAAGRSHSISS